MRGAGASGRRAATLLFALLVACGNGAANGPEPFPITEEELRALQQQAAMEFLQAALAAEMRFYVAEGRFASDPGELEAPPSVDFVVGGGPTERPDEVSVETCEDEGVVVLANAALSGDVFAVKARGLRPASEGEAVFSHYTLVPDCDAEDGPEEWPGGFSVSRQGLQRPEED